MSLVPNENREIVAQQIELKPFDSNDPQNLWIRFIDTLRRTIGLKPLYLAERWAEAKVRQEEVEADAKLLAAKCDYERAMAEVRKMELEAKGTYEKNLAEADVKYSRAELNRLTATLLQAKKESAEDVVERLLSIVTRIESHGGSVEFCLPELTVDNLDKSDDKP